MVAATDLISSLGKHYIHSETAVKRQIVSSVFPSGLVYGEKKVRTLELNKVMSRILSIDKGFGGPKKRKHTNFGMLSLQWSRQESEHRSRCFCQRQNTIPAHTFIDNYCCGVHRHFFELV